jgi:oligopeptide transport system substrate-binding protein
MNNYLIILIMLIGGCMSSHDTIITAQLKPLEKGQQLDPSLVRFVTEYFYLDNMLIKLIDLSPDGTYRNALAENIDISEDKKKLTISLKEAYFSDQTPITAHDVVQTFKRVILQGATHSKPKEYIKGADKLTKLDDNIEGLKVLSEKSFSLSLNAPMKELYFFLHLTDFGVLHPKQYEKEKLTVKDWSSNNSGPYHLIEKDGEYIFEAHDKSLNSHPEMPTVVKMKFYDENEIVDALSKNKIDFGLIRLKSYATYLNELKSIKNINYYGDKSDGIIYLSLNAKSSKFSDQKVRQWFNKRVQKNYTLTEDQENYLEKANQYFLPKAKGHISQENIESILKDLDIDKIPDVLKKGVTIRTVSGMKDYLPHNFKEMLEKSIGVPVSIDFSMKSENMIEELDERNFEIFLMASSMSYKVIGETLNLVYQDKGALFLNPNGEIKKMLKDYQATDDTAKETAIITSILNEMTTDSECIPITYFTNPKFFNKNKLNIQKMHLNESFQFWHLRAK